MTEDSVAGWYPDPRGTGSRWWDGSAWTEHVAEGGRARHGGPEPEWPAAVASSVPCVVPGTELLGAYPDSGFDGQRFLIRRSDGHVALVSPLLYDVVSEIDGQRSVDEVADAVSTRTGRRLTAANLTFLIDSKLSPLGVATREGFPVAATKARTPLLGLSVHGALVPASLVRRLGRWLAPLFHPLLIVVALGGLVAFDVWFIVEQGLSLSLYTVMSKPGLLLAFFGLLFASAVFHEFGHAAACSYGGGRPGSVGIGIYLLFPACYTDVTDAYRLPRRARIRTDLGGIYFNAVFCALAGAVDLMTRSPVLPLVIVMTHVLALQQLLPVARFDGYFLLADVVGVPDLFGGAAPAMRGVVRGRRRPDRRWSGLRPRVRAAVIAWVAVAFPLLLAASVYMVIRLPRFARMSWRSIDAESQLTRRAFDAGAFTTSAVAALSVLLLAIPLVGLALLVGRGFAHGGQRLARTRLGGRRAAEARPARRHGVLRSRSVGASPRARRAVVAGLAAATIVAGAILVTDAIAHGGRPLIAPPADDITRVQTPGAQAPGASALVVVGDGSRTEASGGSGRGDPRSGDDGAAPARANDTSAIAAATAGADQSSSFAPSHAATPAVAAGPDGGVTGAGSSTTGTTSGGAALPGATDPVPPEASGGSPAATTDTVSASSTGTTSPSTTAASPTTGGGSGTTSGTASGNGTGGASTGSGTVLVQKSNTATAVNSGCPTTCRATTTAVQAVQVGGP